MSLSRMTVAASLIFFSAVAAAQTPPVTPPIVGTWVGVSSATVFGANPYFNTKEGDEVKFLETEFTIVIDRAEGRNFAGQVSAADITEPLIGTFRADLKRGVMVDYDGTYEFELTSPDQLELCYTHPVSATGRSAVAACNELTRQ